MGKLVRFDSQRKVGSASRPDGTGEAEILIFTGVRYERQSAETPTKPTASSSGGKRKRG